MKMSWPKASTKCFDRTGPRGDTGRSRPNTSYKIQGTIMQPRSGGVAIERLEPRVLLASVELVRDINADAEHLGPRPSKLTVVGNTLYFVGNDHYHGYELWKTDGTAAGTALVKDLIPGPAVDTTHTPPRALTAFNGTLYFVARDSGFGNWQVWKTDGTEAGTVPVTDLPDGVSENGPLVVMGGHLYFRAYGGTNAGLWRTNGTSAGTTMVSPVFPESLTA